MADALGWVTRKDRSLPVIWQPRKQTGLRRSRPWVAYASCVRPVERGLRARAGDAVGKILGTVRLTGKFAGVRFFLDSRLPVAHASFGGAATCRGPGSFWANSLPPVFSAPDRCDRPPR